MALRFHEMFEPWMPQWKLESNNRLKLAYKASIASKGFGLYLTSRLVWKPGKFAKSGLPETERLFIWSRNFWYLICVKGPYLMKMDNLNLVGKMFENISPDSVRSGRTCQANLGVRSCPVGKLICPVRSSPIMAELFVYVSDPVACSPKCELAHQIHQTRSQAWDKTTCSWLKMVTVDFFFS